MVVVMGNVACQDGSILLILNTPLVLLWDKLLFLLQI